MCGWGGGVAADGVLLVAGRLSLAWCGIADDGNHAGKAAEGRLMGWNDRCALRCRLLLAAKSIYILRTTHIHSLIQRLRAVRTTPLSFCTPILFLAVLASASRLIWKNLHQYCPLIIVYLIHPPAPIVWIHRFLRSSHCKSTYKFCFTFAAYNCDVGSLVASSWIAIFNYARIIIFRYNCLFFVSARFTVVCSLLVFQE